MSMKEWERRVLEQPGATERVAEITNELRLAAGLTALRERAGLAQRDVADRLQVSQPRVVAIERSKNVTIDVLDHYVRAVGGRLELMVEIGGKRFDLRSNRALRMAPRPVEPAKTPDSRPVSKTARKTAANAPKTPVRRSARARLIP
jgi:transcriptional regulator with XRE-family HTH domain